MSKSNLLQMPNRKENHRANAAKILKAYYAVKKPPTPKVPFVGLTQAQIDGRNDGWERESESTNARLARILGGEK